MNSETNRLETMLFLCVAIDDLFCGTGGTISLVVQIKYEMVKKFRQNVFPFNQFTKHSKALLLMFRTTS